VVMKAAIVIPAGGVLLNCCARVTGLRHCRHSMGRVQHCHSERPRRPRTVESIMGTNRHAPTGWLTALVLTLLAAGCSATNHPLGTDPRLASPPTSALQAAQGPPTPPDLPPGLVAD